MPSGAHVVQGKAQISGNTMRVGLKAVGAGKLQRALARAFGRYAHDRRKFYVPRRRSMTLTDPMVYARAVHFAATLLAAGVVYFRFFVAEPAFAMASDELSPAIERLRSRWLWIVWISLAVAVLSAAVWLVLLAVNIFGAPIAEVWRNGGIWTVVTETRFGAKLVGAVGAGGPTRSILGGADDRGNARSIGLRSSHSRHRLACQSGVDRACRRRAGFCRTIPTDS